MASQYGNEVSYASWYWENNLFKYRALSSQKGRSKYYVLLSLKILTDPEGDLPKKKKKTQQQKNK